jgi:hypothetical protein
MGDIAFLQGRGSISEIGLHRRLCVLQTIPADSVEIQFTCLNTVSSQRLLIERRTGYVHVHDATTSMTQQVMMGLLGRVETGWMPEDGQFPDLAYFAKKLQSTVNSCQRKGWVFSTELSMNPSGGGMVGGMIVEVAKNGQPLMGQNDALILQFLDGRIHKKSRASRSRI